TELASALASKTGAVLAILRSLRTRYTASTSGAAIRLSTCSRVTVAATNGNVRKVLIDWMRASRKAGRMFSIAAATAARWRGAGWRGDHVAAPESAFMRTTTRA